MRIKMRGRERVVTDRIGRTLVLLKKAEEVVEAPQKRVYKRRDIVTAAPLVVEEPAPIEHITEDPTPEDSLTEESSE